MIARCPSCNFGNQISMKTVQYVCRKCGMIVRWDKEKRYWVLVND